MTTHRIALRRFAHGTLAVALVLLFCVGFAPSAFAQWCTIPGTPPFPPPPPKPPKPCAPYKCKTCSASPCFLATGVYETSELDLHVGTPSFALMAARSYESNRAVDGPVGVGWTSSLMPRVYYATYLLSAPSTYSYQAELVPMSGPSLTFTGNANGTFTAPFGSKDLLVRNGDLTWDWFPEHTDTKVRFNADGTMQRISDRWNNSMSFIYGANGRLSRMQDDMGSGRYFDVGWGADGRIATVTDNSGRVLRYEYGTDGTLIRVTNPLGQITRLTYTAGRFGPLLASIKDHWDRVITQLEWYDDDKLESYTEGEYTGVNSRGEKFSYQYFPNALPSPYTVRSHSLGAMSHTYSSSNWIVNKSNQTVDSSTGAPLTEMDGGVSTSYTYDSLGRRISMKKGNTWWKFTYDPNFPNQTASSIAYSNAGMTTVDTNWPGFHFIYAAPGTNGAGSLKEVQKVRTDGTIGWIERYNYDARGRVTSSSDVSTFTTSYTYNTQGDVQTVTTPTGTSTFEYDSLGRVTTITDEMGKVTSLTYDALGRPLTHTLPLPSAGSPAFTTTYSYDHFDSVKGFTYTHVTDPNGRVRKYGFDALGNQTEEIDELNNVTSFNYKYNLLDNITDANGNVLGYVYNSNRVHFRTVHPDGKTETFNSANGLVSSKIDRRGITTSYAYDAHGRPGLIRSTLSNGQTLETTTLSYTGHKLMSIAYQKGADTDTTTYTYDTAYRVLTETQGTRAKVTYTYQIGSFDDRVYGYSIGPAAGGTATSSATYTYDNKARLRTINWSKLSGSFTLSYNARDQYTEILFPTGNKRLYTYDDQGRAKTVSTTDSGGGNVVRYTYNWDYNWATLSNTMLGQLSHIDVVADANTGQQVGRTSYTYDNAYRLLRADRPNGYYEAFTYDAIGNRITSSATGGSQVTYTYVQNASNKNTARLLSDGSSGNYVYDDNGNYIGRTLFNEPHLYDAQNRLTNVGDTVEAVYDANSRRIKSRVGSGVDKTYIYVGEQVVQEKTAGWNLDFTYLMGPGLDEPLAVAITDGTVHYMVADAQDSFLGLIAAADDSYSHDMSYTSFGRDLRGVSYNIPSYGYSGRERSPSNNYMYYRFRHYDTRLGRFLSEDPIQEFVPVIGAAQYAYVSNSPVMNTDPYGLAQCETKLKWGPSSVQEEWSEDWWLKSKSDLPFIIPMGPSVPLLKKFMFKWPLKKDAVHTVGTVETCLWQAYFQSTTYLIKKWYAITTCKCPDSVDIYEGESKTVLDKYIKMKTKTTTTKGLITPGKYKPCPKPN